MSEAQPVTDPLMLAGTTEAGVKKDEPKAEPKLTREQRRMVDRANEEAGRMHKRLVDQFYEFFLDNTITPALIDSKKKEVAAKWRVYCKQRGLTAEALGLVEKTCDEILEQFNNELNETALPS